MNMKQRLATTRVWDCIERAVENHCASCSRVWVEAHHAWIASERVHRRAYGGRRIRGFSTNMAGKLGMVQWYLRARDRQRAAASMCTFSGDVLVTRRLDVTLVESVAFHLESYEQVFSPRDPSLGPVVSRLQNVDDIAVVLAVDYAAEMRDGELGG